MEIVLIKTDLPGNVIDIVIAFLDPVNFVINSVEIKFLADSADSHSCLIQVIDPIAKTDKFQKIIQQMDKADWLMDSTDRYVIQSYWTSDPLDIQKHKHI